MAAPSPKRAPRALEISTTTTSSYLYRGLSRPSFRIVGPAASDSQLADLVEQFADTYPRETTARCYRQWLRSFVRFTGVGELDALTPAMVQRWCTTNNPANNTVVSRISVVRSFFAWCRESGYETPDIERVGKNLRRSYPRTYGKVQAKNPGRWLTHDEAFAILVGACHDGTVRGMRDEIIIRLGLSGVRATEITAMTIGALRFRSDQRVELCWTGKGRKPRTVVASTQLSTLLARWLDLYRDGLGHAPATDMPLLTTIVHGFNNWDRMAWGQPLRGGQNTVWDIVTRRAKSADLGHVAPHDLRRSCAGILHRATNSDGAHFFDLMDIQQVLDHSDPATTMRSYLAPMDTDVLDRASDYLD